MNDKQRVGGSWEKEASPGRMQKLRDKELQRMLHDTGLVEQDIVGRHSMKGP